MTADELREAVALVLLQFREGEIRLPQAINDLLAIPYIAEAITSKQRIDNMRLGASIGTGTRSD